MAKGNSTLPRPQADVFEFLAANVSNQEIYNDCIRTYEIMERISGEKGILWGQRMIGFGKFHYVYPTGRQGEWMHMGFGPLKDGLSFYLTMYEADGAYKQDLAQLGKHKMGKSCLNVRRLKDVDMGVLERILETTWRLAGERCPHGVYNGYPSEQDRHIKQQGRNYQKSCQVFDKISMQPTLKNDASSSRHSHKRRTRAMSQRASQEVNFAVQKVDSKIQAPKTSKIIAAQLKENLAMATTGRKQALKRAPVRQPTATSRPKRSRL